MWLWPLACASRLAKSKTATAPGTSDVAGHPPPPYPSGTQGWIIEDSMALEAMENSPVLARKPGRKLQF